MTLKRGFGFFYTNQPAKNWAYSSALREIK